MTVDEARAALHGWLHDEWGDLCDPDCPFVPRLDALIAAVRAETREEYGEVFAELDRLGIAVAESDERLRALRKALTAISEFSDEPEARMARAALDATTEPKP